MRRWLLTVLSISSIALKILVAVVGRSVPAVMLLLSLVPKLRQSTSLSYEHLSTSRRACSDSWEQLVVSDGWSGKQLVYKVSEGVSFSCGSFVARCISVFLVANPLRFGR